MSWTKSSALIMALTPVAGLHAESLEDAFDHATTTGQFRLGYISVNPDVAGEKTTTGAGLGGQIKFETAEWNHFQFAVAPYFVEKFDMLSGDKDKSELNTDFLDADGESYAYLGEAYVNYRWANGSARLGRQQIETPFINTDEIRHFPNTFNAAWVNLNLGPSLSLDAGVVSQWAGFDSGSLDKFIKARTDGVATLGISYQASDALAVQGWYYDFVKEFGLLYTDVTYTHGALEVGGQYLNYSEKNHSGTDGVVLGLTASYTVGAVSFSAALNKGSNADGKSADLGMGGGNFYTSMDESTIAGLNDASAQVIAVSYTAANDFLVTLAQGHFENKGKTLANTDETDIILGYKVNKKLDIEFTHASIDNKANSTDAATNFTRQLMRVNYTF